MFQKPDYTALTFFYFRGLQASILLLIWLCRRSYRVPWWLSTLTWQLMYAPPLDCAAFRQKSPVIIAVNAESVLRGFHYCTTAHLYTQTWSCQTCLRHQSLYCKLTSPSPYATPKQCTVRTQYCTMTTVKQRYHVVSYQTHSTALLLPKYINEDRAMYILNNVSVSRYCNK